MKLPWFSSSATAAPARSGTGLSSTYAADRAEALAAYRTTAAAALEKQVRAINAQLAKVKEQSAQSILKAEAEAEATRKRVGEGILAEFYGAAEDHVRAHLAEPTRGAALGLRDAYMHFSARSLVETGVTQGTEVVGLAFASVLVADVPAAVTAFAEFKGDLFSVSLRCVADPLLWCEEIEQLERRLVGRVSEYARRGYEVTDYHRRYFHAITSAPTASDRGHAIAVVNGAQEARSRADFAASYVAPPQVVPLPRARGMFGAPEGRS